MRTAVLVSAALACLAGGSACAVEFVSPPPPAPVGTVVAAWSQIVGQAKGQGAEPAVELRYVINGNGGEGCAAYDVAYVTEEGAGIAPTGARRANPDPTRFPVTLCAVPLDAEWTTARIIPRGGDASAPAVEIFDGQGPTGVDAAVPGPHSLGRRHKDHNGDPALRLVTMGDSGCRGGTRQDCAHDWSLGEIAASALSFAPDLVIHVGDYRYFEEGTSPDTWAYWLQDFLAPARGLLAGAPWALARGNHEQCGDGWYGTGYTYLFGPSGQNACDFDGNATFYFDVAPQDEPMLTHRFVMVDTSNRYSPELAAEFGAALDASTASTWWVTHIPPANLLRYAGSDGETVTNVGDPRIAAALDDAIKTRSEPLCHEARPLSSRCRPSTLLMGHQHLFQTVVFAQSVNPATVTHTEVWPQIVIVGHGGVAPDKAGLSGSSPCRYSFSLPGIDGVDVNGIVRSRSENGFVVWTRSADTRVLPSGWHMSPRGADGVVWALREAVPDPCLTADE